MAAGQVLECVEEVVEGPVGAGGVAGRVEVHEEAADDGENERRELRPADAAQAVFQWPEPVRHLLLISSYLPEVGQSLSEFGDGAPAPFLDIDPGAGTFGVRPELLVDTFLQDCDPEDQARAADRLARQSVRVTGEPVGAAAWQQVPSTYLVCAQDRGTPARLQREFARRAGKVVELDAGHHPFLSRPAAVRDLLLSL